LRMHGSESLSHFHAGRRFCSHTLMCLGMADCKKLWMTGKSTGERDLGGDGGNNVEYPLVMCVGDGAWSDGVLLAGLGCDGEACFRSRGDGGP
jgi:hypothetical protein